MPSTAIISELSQISQVVAGLPSSTPYLVPPDYFQSLAADMLYRITVIEQSQTDPVISMTHQKSTPYQVPPGYFNDLADNILFRIKTSEVLTSQDDIETLSPLLSGIGKKMPLSIPDNYFEELALPVFANHISADDDVQISPLLQAVRTTATYQMPPGYFIDLPGTILKKVKTTGTARVIPMSFTRKLARYAIAASVAGIIAVSGWFYFQKQPGLNTGLADIKNISSQELQDFVDKNTVILPEGNTVTADDMNPDDIKVMLAGVTTEELQQYVDQQPVLKDPATTNFN